MDYDPFGLSEFQDLENFSQILINMTSVLEVVKIVMEQEGFTGSGLNVTVNVAPAPVNLIM